ncbi:FxsB family cyclophane-forming radical SAM/SPASM peptide maturase [Plantactinospora siamensis]|uniref:FxsB family cyclophane-forming radical SAM/SPASM peptide maturase n=1 Tax=Plantactinospora siamensis TaxID=555372 RepID=A0ABV6NZ00_9ACTN
MADRTGIPPVTTPAIAASGADGWRPTPFHEYVLKVHSRCDLACTYCYMYQLADSGWRDQPRSMSDRVLGQTCRRVAEHVAEHRLPAVRVVLHGGEPLLVGPSRLAAIARRVRAAVPDATVDVTVQTNAVLLDEAGAAALAEAGVRVGVSLDGDRRANDRHRRSARGDSSYDRACRGIELLRAAGILAGILCVVSLDNDPVGTYDALVAHEPPLIDLLLPHGNWTSPPPGRGSGAETPYGDWLSAAFDRWYDEPARVGVRLFEETVNVLLGGASRSESIGLSPVATIVVNADGALEQIDTLRSTYHGAAGTGLNVFTHRLDDALAHPAVVARQLGARALAAGCRSCRIRDTCGGGYYPHRYRAGAGFDNPSVYCPDLLRFVDHVAGRLRVDIARLAVPA